MNITAANIPLLTKEQIQQISPKDVRDLEGYVQYFKPQQLYFLQAKQIQALTTQQLQSLSVTQLEALNHQPRNSIEKILKVRKYQIKETTPEKIKKLGKQVRYFSDSQLNQFTKEQIEALTSRQIYSLELRQLLIFSNKEKELGLKPDIVKRIDHVLTVSHYKEALDAEMQKPSPSVSKAIGLSLLMSFASSKEKMQTQSKRRAILAKWIGRTISILNGGFFTDYDILPALFSKLSRKKIYPETILQAG